METDYMFQRGELLLGRDVMNVLAEKRVIVFGVGGVGSWCAEGLVRSGIRYLTLVDNDCVNITNINRQLMATCNTVGEPKVHALRKRLLEINPNVEILALQDVYNEDSAESFHVENYDYVIDAIDSLKDKAHLILNVTAKGVKLFSSMGAALKLDPMKIAVAEFWNVKGCPLGAALRRKFKKNKTFPKNKFKCVYSEELLKNKGSITDWNMSGAWDGMKAQINGSLVHITAVFGFTLCSLVIQDVVNNSNALK